jgi:hypothetical protein
MDRGVAVCGSGVGASVCANKIKGVRACLIEDHFSAKQGVEDDNLNVICLGGRIEGPELAWDLVQLFSPQNSPTPIDICDGCARWPRWRHKRFAKTTGGNHDRRGNDSMSDQHDPHAFDRCGPAGEIRTSRYTNGAGAVDLYDLESRHAL